MLPPWRANASRARRSTPGDIGESAARPQERVGGRAATATPTTALPRNVRREIANTSLLAKRPAGRQHELSSLIRVRPTLDRENAPGVQLGLCKSPIRPGRRSAAWHYCTIAWG